MEHLVFLMILGAAAAVAVTSTSGSSSGDTIQLDASRSVQLKPSLSNFEIFYRRFMEYFRPPSVSHFAEHSLCKSLRRQFEIAMTKKLWSMPESFVKRFVHTMCEKKRNKLLKLWVSELFDSDGNGYIDDHEKNAVIDKNNAE